MRSQVAVVTGGNRGIGVEACRQLAALGYRVVLTGRDASQVERAASELRKGKADVVPHALDVADRASIEAFAQTMERDSAPIDALINNAGISLHGFDAKVAAQTLEVNVFGPMRLTDRLMPKLADEARVIMVSSGMGEVSCLSSNALRDRILSDRLTRGELTSLLQGFVTSVERGDFAKKGWPSNAYSVSKVGLNAFTRVLS